VAAIRNQAQTHQQDATGGAGAPHPARRGLRCAAREAALPALTLCQTPLTWRAPAGAPAPHHATCACPGLSTQRAYAHTCGRAHARAQPSKGGRHKAGGISHAACRMLRRPRHDAATGHRLSHRHLGPDSWGPNVRVKVRQVVRWVQLGFRTI